MNNEEIQKIVMKSEKEYEELKDTLHEQYNEIQDLKQRIDKAVEYIEKNKLINNLNYMDNGVGDLFNNVLNILKGNDTKVGE